MIETVLVRGEKRRVRIVHDSFEIEERVFILAGEGAEIEIDEVFTSPSDSRIRVVHSAPRTKSLINTRGVVDKSQAAIAHACVVIPKSSYLCESSVSQRFLLLDCTARAEAIPSLEIEASEVKASHECAIAPIDESKIFYAESRGLSRGDAKKLLIDAFLAGGAL